MPTPTEPDDTVIVSVRLSRAAARHLVDQLLPPDPTLEQDLAVIRRQAYAAMAAQRQAEATP
jgi:hypothetical protein